MLDELTLYTDVLGIVGDILTIRATDVGFGDLAVVENWDGATSLAQVIELQDDSVSLQVFTGGKGLSTQARVRFLGHPFQVPYSANILGRIFNGAGNTIDGGPELFDDPRIDVGGSSRSKISNKITTQPPQLPPRQDRAERQPGVPIKLTWRYQGIQIPIGWFLSVSQRSRIYKLGRERTQGLEISENGIKYFCSYLSSYSFLLGRSNHVDDLKRRGN